MPVSRYLCIFINVGLGEGAKLNAATATLGRTGFIAIPVMIGGIEQSVIIQWGWNAAKASASGGDGNTVVFPVAFNNACVAVVANYDNVSAPINAVATGDIQPLRFYYGAQLKRVVITITGLLLGIKMKIYCCLNTVGFFMDGCGVIPPDSKEITAEHWQSLLKSQAEGGVIDFSVFPPSIKEVIRTHDDEVADANFQKQMLISDATDFINSRQWQGKAALGRLKEDELKQYNLWLDYLEALELVDTSSAPDIEWPTPPAVQAR